MIMVWEGIFFLLVCVGLCAGGLAAYSDLRGMRIPNRYVLIVLVSFLVALGLGTFVGGAYGFGVWWGHVLAGVFVFVLSYALYVFSNFGAGDSKLLTAFSFWIGIKGLPVFLFYVTISGALLALLALAIGRWKPFGHAKEGSWVARLQKGERNVPYGVAIWAGSVIAFFYLDYLAWPSLLGFFSPDLR